MPEDINNEDKGKKVDMDKISKIPVDFSIEVGKISLTLAEVMALKEGDVVALNKLCNDPFDIKVNNKKIAEGEIVQNENKFFVKVSNILDKVD